MGVGPQVMDSASISSADFNENGFIDEEDLQKIVLRLLKSDDVSEDLLMDVTHHVGSQRLKGGTQGSRWSPQLPDTGCVLKKGSVQSLLQPLWGWVAPGALRSGYTVERAFPQLSVLPARVTYVLQNNVSCPPS